MMKKLWLPCHRYKSRDVAYGNYGTEVRFYPSVPFLQTSPVPHSMLGYPEESADSAVRRAIRYMETVENKVPKEIQTDMLEKEKKRIRGLLRKLKCTCAELIKKSMQMKDIVHASDTYVEKICVCTDQIQKIGSEGSSSGSGGSQYKKYARALLEINAMAIYLAQHSVEMIEEFKAVKVHPYGEGGTECDSSSECHDSDAHHCKSDIYDFNSDGRLHNYDDSTSN